MAGESLAVDEVVVAYDATTVLDGVSLQVAPGEFVALLGSSGCGKTTLLRAISGFIRVRSGRILVSDRDITELPPEKRDMAMVFQSYALWPHMSAAQNVAYGLRIRGMAKAERERRVEEVLALLGLAGLGARPVTQLSGGQRQRVALGRALAINPRILLLDEPLSNLDARIRQSVRHEIKALQGQLGITAIHVTHDREEAMVMADRIAIMDAGEIVQLGAPETVYNRPVSPFVASFMGADNVLHLTARRENGTVRIPAGGSIEETTLPVATSPETEGVHLGAPLNGAAVAHFRSEAAQIATGDTPPGHLVLHGEITQSSYPGGFYRYVVQVGDKRFMVDDERLLAVGDPVRLCLPAKTLHLFPES